MGLVSCWPDRWVRRSCGQWALGAGRLASVVWPAAALGGLPGLVCPILSLGVIAHRGDGEQMSLDNQLISAPEEDGRWPLPSGGRPWALLRCAARLTPGVLRRMGRMIALRPCCLGPPPGPQGHAALPTKSEGPVTVEHRQSTWAEHRFVWGWTLPPRPPILFLWALQSHAWLVSALLLACLTITGCGPRASSTASSLPATEPNLGQRATACWSKPTTVCMSRWTRDR